MNRILEAYEGDDEFTRSRLIDEDETTQHDLKIIKVCYAFFNQFVQNEINITSY